MGEIKVQTSFQSKALNKKKKTVVKDEARNSNMKQYGKEKLESVRKQLKQDIFKTL
eukprot:m.129409 g.129409  ORF g.129409 m.129409 type:complete len:56 (+) comp13046_c2_seq4:1013-1180(+)